MLKDGEFASMGLDDISLHEYGHKIYWDKAKELYNSNKKLYNSVIEASMAYEGPLRKYIKTKLLSDKLYVMKYKQICPHKFIGYEFPRSVF